MVPRPRIRIDKRTVSKGDIVEVQALISHLMETGERKDGSGALVPRQILSKFRCDADGQQIFAVNLTPAVTANPYIRFKFKPQRSIDLLLTWTEDNGSVVVAEEKITVK